MTDKDKLDSRVLRRINDYLLEKFMGAILDDDDYDPCYYEDVDEYITSLCDLLKDDYLSYIRMSDTNPKTKDALYYYLVKKFYKLLFRIYKGREC
jgi:hypothetical protein